jgi:hypothetical protein
VRQATAGPREVARLNRPVIHTGRFEDPTAGGGSDRLYCRFQLLCSQRANQWSCKPQPHIGITVKLKGVSTARQRHNHMKGLTKSDLKIRDC